MTVSNQNPAADSLVLPGETISFDLNDGGTTPTVFTVTVNQSTDDVVWTLASGFQPGYSGTAVKVGNVYTITFESSAGFDASPFTVLVDWTISGTPSSASWSYELRSQQLFPNLMEPRNPINPGGTHSALTGLDADDHPQYLNTTRADAAYKPIEISGAGAPGVSTGNGKALGTIYIDTTAEAGYILVDNTTDNNVWKTGGGGGGVTDHGALTGLGDDDHPQYQTKVMERIAGSTYSTVQHLQDIFHSSGLSSGGVIADAGSGQITVTTGTGFIRATDDALDTLLYFDFPNLTATTITDQATRYVGVEYNSGTPQVVVRTTDVWDNNTEFRLGTVSRDGTTLHISQAPHQVGDHAGIMIERGREVMPLVRDNRTGGLALGEDGANRYVTVTAGALWEGLSRYTIPAFDTDPGGAADTMTRIYRDGVGGWTYEAAQTTWNNTQYDDGSGTLATMTNNRYAAQYIYVTVEGALYMQYGQAEYTSLGQVGDDTVPAVPFWFKDHCKLVGRIIFQKSASAATSIESAFDTTLTGTPVSDHGALAGLGDDDHTQYVLGAGTRAQDAALFTERADHVNAPAAGAAELWLRNDTPNNLMFTDDAGTDHIVVKGPASSTAFAIPTFNGTDGGLLRSTLMTFSSGKLALGSNGNVNMDERASAPSTSAGEGVVWVRNDAPNTLMFTDDEGTDLAVSRAPLMKAIFDTSTTDSDPGAVYQGGVRFNNATMTSATQVFIDNQDPDGMGHASLTAYLQSGTSVIFYKAKDPTQHIRVRVEKTENNAGTYHTLYAGGVVASTGWTTPDLGEELYFEFQGPSIEGRYHTQFKQSGTTLPLGITGDYVSLWADTSTRYYLYDHNTTTSTEIVQADGVSNQDAVLFDERSDHVNTFPSGGKGELWLHNGTPNTLCFTDDAAGDNYLVTTTANLTDGYIPTWTSNSDDQAKLDNPGDLYYQGGSLRIQSNSSEILLKERASISSSFANYGHIWVKNDAPTTARFRDDAGNDYELGDRVYRFNYPARCALTASGAYARFASWQPNTYQSSSVSSGATQGTPDTLPTSRTTGYLVPFDGFVTRIHGTLMYSGSAGSDTYVQDLELWRWYAADGASSFTGAEVGATGGFLEISDTTTGTGTSGIQYYNFDIPITSSNAVSKGDILELLFYNVTAGLSGYPIVNTMIEISRTNVST